MLGSQGTLIHFNYANLNYVIFLVFFILKTTLWSSDEGQYRNLIENNIFFKKKYWYALESLLQNIVSPEASVDR